MHRPNTKSFRTKSMPCGASRSIAPTRLGNDAPAGNPLDQSAAGRKRIEPQAQCDRCPRARALRGEGAGAMGQESVQLFICKRSASAIRPGNGGEGERRATLPAGKSELQLDLPADQLVTLREGQGIVKRRPFR